MVLLSTDREQLVAWRDAIALFLRERLALELRPGTRELLPLAGGVEFVGWKTWWNHRVPRRQTLGNLTVALDRFALGWTKPAFGGAAVRIDLTRRQPVRRVRGRAFGAAPGSPVEALRDVLASYAGHLSHGNAGTQWEELWRTRGWLAGLFARDRWQLAMRWPEPSVAALPPTAAESRYGDRYRRAIVGAGDDCLVFWRVGRFVEFHGPQRVLAERVLGLRSVPIGRGDYAFTAGFPFQLSSIFVARAVAAVTSVVLLSAKTGRSPDATHRLTLVAARSAADRAQIRRRPSHMSSKLQNGDMSA